MKKLFKYGVKNREYDLLKSYLTDRYQSVIFKDKVSQEESQIIGVVQGSKLGPLLYDAYSTDFNQLCSENEGIMYADDTCLVYVGEDLPALATHVYNKLH